MTTTRLNPLDASWVITESRAAPNHVGGLLQFRLPPGAYATSLLRALFDVAFDMGGGGSGARPPAGPAGRAAGSGGDSDDSVD